MSHVEEFFNKNHDHSSGKFAGGGHGTSAVEKAGFHGVHNIKTGGYPTGHTTPADKLAKSPRRKANDANKKNLNMDSPNFKAHRRAYLIGKKTKAEIAKPSVKRDKRYASSALAASSAVEEFFNTKHDKVGRFAFGNSGVKSHARSLNNDTAIDDHTRSFIQRPTARVSVRDGHVKVNGKTVGLVTKDALGGGYSYSHSLKGGSKSARSFSEGVTSVVNAHVKKRRARHHGLAASAEQAYTSTVEEFMNKNHDKIGRFAQGSGHSRVKVGGSGARYIEDKHGETFRHPEDDSRKTFRSGGKIVGRVGNSGTLRYPGQVTFVPGQPGSSKTAHGEPEAKHPMPPATHTKTKVKVKKTGKAGGFFTHAAKSVPSGKQESPFPLAKYVEMKNREKRQKKGF